MKVHNIAEYYQKKSLPVDSFVAVLGKKHWKQLEKELIKW